MSDDVNNYSAFVIGMETICLLPNRTLKCDKPIQLTKKSFPKCIGSFLGIIGYQYRTITYEQKLDRRGSSSDFVVILSFEIPLLLYSRLGRFRPSKD